MIRHMNRIFGLAFIVLLLVGLALLTGQVLTARAAGVIYVDADATGANNGTSWANAYTNLQSALTAATYGDKIWVADGTYKPTTGVTRSLSFQLRPGVALYGGFAATETQRSQRNWATHVTTLSGDIGAAGVMTDNAYHVVVGSGVTESAVLDGFTVTDGYANGAATEGAGMYVASGSPTVRNCVFSHNRAESVGGGAYVNNSSATFINVAFVGNSAVGFGGGGIYHIGGNLLVVNAVFRDNLAPYWDGGGLFNWGSSSNVTVINSTFYSNSALYGGGMANVLGTSVVSNSILWGNSATNTGPQLYGAHTLTYTIAQGGYTTGTLTADPQFVDAAHGDLRLMFYSPAVDAGLNSALPGEITADLAGGARFVDVPSRPDTGSGTPPIVDLGAYEAVPVAVLYVDRNAVGANTGLSWTDAYTDLQSALSVVLSSQEIWIAEGVYKPTTGITRDISFQLKPGVALYGGFAATETQRSQRNWTAHVVTLSGDIGAAGVATDNTYHVVVGGGVTESAVLDGFTITGGYANGDFPHDRGGGIYMASGSPTVRHCVFSHNQAGMVGGGACADDSNATFTNVTFVGNSGGSWGGGGIYHNGGNLLVANAVFRNNLASQWDGGGLFNWGTGSNVTVINSTFYSNSAMYGGGIANVLGTSIVSNTILWNNSATTSGQQLYGAHTLTYTIAQGGYTTGTLTADPQFVDAAHGDLRLMSYSPAIDAGLNAAVPSGITTDLAGGARFVDMPGRPDTGSGTPPIVDLGAYECTTHTFQIFLPLVIKTG